MKSKVTKIDTNTVSTLWPSATTNGMKERRMPWGLCALDLPTEGKANNQKDCVGVAEQLAVFPQQFPLTALLTIKFLA